MTAAHPLLVQPAYPFSLTIHRLDFAPFASLFIIPHHGRQSPYLSPLLLQLQALQSTRTICTLPISAPQADHIHSFSSFAQSTIFLPTTPKRHFSRRHQRNLTQRYLRPEATYQSRLIVQKYIAHLSARLAHPQVVAFPTRTGQAGSLPTRRGLRCRSLLRSGFVSTRSILVAPADPFVNPGRCTEKSTTCAPVCLI